jgi:hypothetical protein
VNGLGPSAVLIDGSALYLAARDLYEGRQLNYHEFVRVLSEQTGVQPAGPNSKTRWVMWTASSPQNAGQNRFLEFAEKELHWDVRRVNPVDSFIIEPNAIRDDSPATRNRLVRFDASIAFAIARLAEKNRLVVVSDSFPLAQPLLLARRLAASEREPAPALAFFSRALDNRWHGLLRRESTETLQFIDLDAAEAPLFGGTKERVEESSKRFGGKEDVF